MGSNIPLVIVVSILTVTAVAAFVAAFVRERKTFAGYEEIQPDIQALKNRLNAEVFRDGTDLVISGSDKNTPVVVRFSYAENTPGMNIRLHAPSTMNMAVIPKNSQFYFPENLRLNVNSPDDQFNSRFLTRADDGSAARMFFMGRSIVKELQKALCSSRTTLNITHGSLELTETTIPEPNTGRHALSHIESLMAMSAVLAQMPGAQLSQVMKPEVPKRLLTKSAIAIGAVAALLSIIGAARQMQTPPTAPKPTDKYSVEQRGAGVTAIDAQVITELENFRVVNPNEMDAGVVSWMRDRGVEPQGRLPLDLKITKTEEGKSTAQGADSSDVAYLLTDPQGKRRVVVLNAGRVVFDARNFGEVSLVRVPAGNIPRSTGVNSPVPEGDGLLLVEPTNPEKSLLMYMSGNTITNRPEPNWTQVDIR